MLLGPGPHTRPSALAAAGQYTTVMTFEQLPTLTRRVFFTYLTAHQEADPGGHFRREGECRADGLDYVIPYVDVKRDIRYEARVTKDGACSAVRL